MRITFLGSSHGVPEPNRQCTSIMIEESGRFYFVDAGVMLMNELVNRGIPVEAAKAVFITHMHGDHTNGLISFVDLLSWYFKTGDPAIFLPKLEGADAIRQWLQVNGTERRAIRFQEVLEGQLYDDGFLKVTAIGTKHCDKSFAYLLEAEGKRVLVTGDLRHPSVDFPQCVKEGVTDLVICEAAHFPAIDYQEILTGCDIKKICVTHYVPWNVPHMQELQKNMGNVVFSNDGMEILV